MYKINPLPRRVLITTDEVIAQGPTDHTVDPRNLMLAIQIAEDRFIKTAICKDLYNDFRDQKNVIVTDVNRSYLESQFEGTVTLKNGQFVNAIEMVSNAAYKDLWNEQLWKAIAECVVYVASPTNFSHYSSQGEMVNNPKSIGMDGQGTATASLEEMKWKMDKLLMDRIDPILAPLQEYICDNITSFPLYNCRKCDCDNDGISSQRKTGWIHNIYGDRYCNDGCNDD